MHRRITDNDPVSAMGGTQLIDAAINRHSPSGMPFDAKIA
jgi:hypothetical protein